MSERTQRKRQPLALRLASEIEASRGRLHKACLACQERLSARRVHNLRAESRRLQLRIELSAAVRGAPVANKAVRRVRTLLHAVGPLRDTQVQLKGLNAALRPLPGLISLRKFLELRERRLAKKP